MAGDDISPEQAHESHQRLVDHYFGNPAERPRIHIPARPTKDDDLVVSAYIDQSTARIAALESELAQLRRGIVANAGLLSNLHLPRWAHVRNAVGVGSTSARSMCRDAGFDPEELVGNP